MFEIQENGQVLKVEQEGEAIIKTHYCMSKQVTLFQEAEGIRVKIRDWEGKFLPLETVTVTIESPETEPLQSICTDGLIEVSGQAGTTVTVKASLTGADPAELVVTL